MENAKITGTQLGTDEHGGITFWLNLEYEHSSQGFGGYDLRYYGITPIVEILRVVEAEFWEDLPGKMVRVERENGLIKRIGNIVKDKWVKLDDK